MKHPPVGAPISIPRTNGHLAFLLITSSIQAEETLEERTQFVQHRLLLQRVTVVFVEARNRRQNLRDRRAGDRDRAVPVTGIVPSRNALSTNALVSPALSPSSAMILSSSSTFLAAMNATHSSSTLAFAETQSTNRSMRSFLLRRLGLALTARSMAARSSLSSPVPFFFRYFSTSIKM